MSSGGGGRAIAAALTLCAGCGPPTGAIGAVFAQSHSDGTVRVREAPSELPAARAGLQRNDELLLVDGSDVRVLSPERLHAVLSGAVGSSVRLTLLRSGAIYRIVVTRAAMAAN